MRSGERKDLEGPEDKPQHASRLLCPLTQAPVPRPLDTVCLVAGPQGAESCGRAQRADSRRSAPGLRIHPGGFVPTYFLPLTVQGPSIHSASPAEARCLPSPVTAPIREGT